MTRARDAADQINRVNSSAANATAITIDSSENVLANTTSTSVIGNGGFAIKPQTGNGTRVDISNAGQAMLLDGAASGPVIGFYGNGTAVGSIGSGSGVMAIAGPSGNGLSFPNNLVLPSTSTAGAKDASTDLGVSYSRFKDLYLSGGVYLGGTGVNNHLHDYEEGLFTVSLALGTGSASLTSNKLFYTKVGRLVTVSGIIRVNSVSGSPNGALSFNVPFACHAPSTGEDNVRASVQTNIVETGNNNEVMLELLEGAVLVSLFKSGTASLGNAGNILKANTTLGINFSYFTST